jgi:hypothetical protein
MRFRTLSCWEAFLQICDAWELNVNLKSRVTPKSFISSSQSIFDSESSYENLLEKSQLPSLRLRRLRSMAIEVFKIINQQTPVYLHDLVTIWKFVPQFCRTISQWMQTIPGGVNSWYVDSVVVSKRVRTFLYSY